MFPGNSENIIEAKKYIANVERLQDELDAARIALEKQEARVKELKEQLNSAVLLLPPTADIDIIEVFVACSYWLSRDIEVKTLRQLCPTKRHRGEWLRELVRHFPLYVTCSRCGNPMQITVNSRTEMDSKRKAGWQSANVICSECKTVLKRRHAEQRSISNQAREQQERELERLRTMPYAEYLQTPHWKNMAAEARRRAGYRCQLCDRSDISLNVHHRTYEHRGQEWRNDLIVLCEDCHKRFHEKLD